jgi:hypothetical protein
VPLVACGHTKRPRSSRFANKHPQGSHQKRPTVITSKAANGSGLGLGCFYAAASCGGKSVFVRQLRGPHLST